MRQVPVFSSFVRPSVGHRRGPAAEWIALELLAFPRTGTFVCSGRWASTPYAPAEGA